MRANIIFGVFLILVTYSCNDMNTNYNPSSNDTIKKSEDLAAETIPEPDNFLGIKLGTDLSSFKENYPNAIQDLEEFYSFDLHLMGCKINFDGMEKPFELNTTTKSDDEVEIDVLFYKNKVAAIYVKYENGLFATDKVYAALTEKYGEPVLYEANSEYYNTKSYYWLTEKSVLNMLYKSELGDLFLVFAARDVQDIIASKTSEDNSKSIE